MREQRNSGRSLGAGGKARAVVENELERDPLNGDLHKNRLCLSDPRLWRRGWTTIETAVISNNSLNLSSSVCLNFSPPTPPIQPPHSLTSSLSPTLSQLLISSSVYPVCERVYDELGQSKVPSEMCCLTALFKTNVRMVDEKDSGCCFEHYNVVFVRYLWLRGLCNQYDKLHITFYL